MADQLTQLKQDLDELKQSRARVNIRLEESVSRAKALKETLAEMGYNSLSEAKDAYFSMCDEAEKKHAKVLELISEIKSVENRIPTKDEILAKLKKQDFKETVPIQTNIPEDSAEKIPDTENEDSDIDSIDDLSNLFGDL